jgi:sulfoxide reductase heme-binding subunit YedZ
VILWYTTRATGLVSLLLLTATAVLGVIGTARFATTRWPRLVTAGLHRNLALLAVGFLSVHILSAILDTYVTIGWVAAIVPFTSGYRPLWVGLGTCALDLFLAMILTSLLRDRIGYRAWRVVHWAAYAAWPIALWHALGTGTDDRVRWVLALDALCALAVLAAVWWRLSLPGDSPRYASRRRLAALASVVVLLATVVFVAVGPLRPGWARRANTTVMLLEEGR